MAEKEADKYIEAVSSAAVNAYAEAAGSANIENVGLLYHYTTIEAFIKIIKSNSIRSSSISYMNDSLEIQHGKNLFLEVIEDGRYLESELISDDGKNLIKSVRHTIQTESQYKVFVSCFSEKSDLLSQWRGYGASVSIGFDFSKPESRVGQYISKVEYDANTSKKGLKSFLDKYVQGRESYRGKFVDHINKWLSYSCCLDVELNLSIHKNDAFSEEREWRVITNYTNSQLLNKETDVDFFIRNGLLIPYVDISPNSGKLPIKEVWIGPHPHSQLLKESISTALSRNHFNKVDIHISNVPFRS